ncbi:hypothetical protein KR018_010656, partial [Drosophila ironensis]
WRSAAEQRVTNIYTDGSKMDERVGAAVYCNNPPISLSSKLPDHYCIFQAEIFAIRKAAEVAQKMETTTKVNVFVDSQAAIKALESKA